MEAQANETTLVFLHHFGGAGRTWTEVIARLENDFRCIAPALKGFGNANVPPGTRFAMDDYANDVAELVRARGLTRWVLVGHSMGGKIALALAARRPGGLAALVLVAPSPPSPEPMTDAGHAQSHAACGDPEAARGIVAMITGDPLPDALRERTVADMICASPAAWQAWLDAGSRENIVDRMSALAVPAFVLAGERDPVVPAALLEREVVSRLTAAQTRLLVIPGAGHLLPLEAPSAVARQIREAAGRA